MSIDFEVKVPDEPFKCTFDLGKVVNLNYHGPRYIVISVDRQTSQVQTHEGFADNLEDINLSEYVDDNSKFYIIDARKHPLEASFITHQYTSQEIDNYEEELPTGETFVYFYEQGILGNIYQSEMPEYFPDTDTFSDLKLLTPAITPDEFLNNIDERIEEYRSRYFTETSSDDEIPDDVREHYDWLCNVRTTYENVDHWKIPYPLAPA